MISDTITPRSERAGGGGQSGRRNEMGGGTRWKTSVSNVFFGVYIGLFWCIYRSLLVSWRLPACDIWEGRIGYIDVVEALVVVAV